ncbi:MAG: class I tRNA ligase family protein, partial [Pirellulaceae bacterium]|nr:class I tRNA ligase family protein [Pirellulaceae bacterium]
MLQEEGRHRIDFDRDEFIARIQVWKDEYEGRITDQLKAMGCSCDWDRQRFTMDAVCTRAVREAFFLLFRDGLIYRGKRLVNWDPATQTALADDEVQMKEVDGSFWYLKYPVVEEWHERERRQIEYVTVATTRPETMLGDTAVAVNPKDPRAAVLVGKHVRLPIVNRVVPIIADEYVVLPDPDSSDEKAKYSSGFLKITPAHDLNDWEVGQRHGLEVINVLAPDGSISKDHGWPAQEFQTGQAKDAEPLLGLSRQDACRAVVEWFKREGLLDQVRPYRHVVGHSYRSHVPIEPYLSDQWYVKVTNKRLAGAALRAMAPQQSDSSEKASPASRERSDVGTEPTKWQGSLRFYPVRYAKTYQTWHENIRDWCISRQLWWGHRIPVWRAKPSRPTHHEFPDFSSDPDDFEQALQERFSRVSAVRGNSIDCFAKLDRVDGHPILYLCARSEDGDQFLELLSDLLRRLRMGETQPTSPIAPLETQAVLEMFELDEMSQDPDVLDTWFSSALWPMSTMGWPEVDHNEVLKKWNP